MADEWKVKTEAVCGECPEAAGSDAKITLSAKAEGQINALLHEFPHLEWIAGLVGKKEGDAYAVEELFVTEQENTAGTTEFTDEGCIALSRQKGIIGWIHSHNNMSVFQSSTDVETAKMHDVSITVNNRGEFYATVRRKLSCGRLAVCEAGVELERAMDREFAEKAKPLVKAKRWVDERFGQEREGQAGLKDYCRVCFEDFQKGASRTACQFCGADCHALCVSERGYCRECEVEMAAENFEKWGYLS